jgi:hypothetical protein
MSSGDSARAVTRQPSGAAFVPLGEEAVVAIAGGGREINSLTTAAWVVSLSSTRMPSAQHIPSNGIAGVFAFAFARGEDVLVGRRGEAAGDDDDDTGDSTSGDLGDIPFRYWLAAAGGSVQNGSTSSREPASDALFRGDAGTRSCISRLLR